ncbi:hypothetical protein ACF087_35310 [Streptomyces goshikiensis]|uniref:hypothetical protein n=1 Tax=Streptomyces goshikiensis TaxID=1942 RepID=UPI0036FDDF2C
MPPVGRTTSVDHADNGPSPGGQRRSTLCRGTVRVRATRGLGRLHRLLDERGQGVGHPQRVLRT